MQTKAVRHLKEHLGKFWLGTPSRKHEDEMEVEIFNYRVWDQMNGSHIIPPRKATREFIERARGSIIEASRTVVDENKIDDEGQEKEAV